MKINWNRREDGKTRSAQMMDLWWQNFDAETQLTSNSSASIYEWEMFSISNPE